MRGGKVIGCRMHKSARMPAANTCFKFHALKLRAKLLAHELAQLFDGQGDGEGHRGTAETVPTPDDPRPIRTSNPWADNWTKCSVMTNPHVA